MLTQQVKKMPEGVKVMISCHARLDPDSCEVDQLSVPRHKVLLMMSACHSGAPLDLSDLDSDQQVLHHDTLIPTLV